MHINANLLQKFCSPEWLSKSYSEYLYDCANVQAELMGDVIEASNDDTLDSQIDTEEENLDLDRQAIADIVFGELIADNVIATELNVGSQSFKTKLQSLLNNHNPEISSRWSNLKTRYSKLTSDNINELYDLDADEIVITAPSIINRIVSLVNTISSKYHMGDNSMYGLGAGFVNFKALIANLISKGSIGAGASEFILSATDGQDTTIANVKTNFSSVIDEMKASFASSIAWASGFSSVGLGTVSDAIANFNASVSTMITNTNEKFSAVVNNVRATLSTYASNTAAFFQQCYNQLGWKEVVSDVFTIIDATQVANFTGASPFSSIYLKTAGDTLAATAKTIGAAASGIFMALVQIVNAGWKKCRGFLSEFTSNPIDFKIEDSDDPYFVMSNAQFHTDGHASRNFTMHIASNVHQDIPRAVAGDLANMINTKTKGSWFSFDTYFGILCFKFNDNARGLGNQLEVGVDIIYKPKMLWHESLTQCGLCHWYRDDDNDIGYFGIRNIGSTNVANFDTWLQNGDLYFHDNMDGTTQLVEGCALIGFNASIMLFSYIAHACMMELNTAFQSKYPWYVDYFTDNVSNKQHRFRADTYPSVLMAWDRDSITPIGDVTVPRNITNEVFAKTCAGDWSYGTSDEIDRFYYYNDDMLLSSSSHLNKRGLIELVGGFLCMFLLQQFDKKQDPTDFFWLPYCKDSFSNDVGRYKIISDAEHANVVGIVTAALVVIATVVAVVMLGTTVIKIFKARKLAKWSARQGVLDNAMWNNHKLTTFEALKYQRACKKNGTMSSASSGLAGAASTVQSIAESCNNLMNTQAVRDALSSSTDVATNQSYSQVERVIKLIAG